MNRNLIFIAILIFLTTCNSRDNYKIEYPATKQISHADTIFGTVVPDPYRWLEDDMSEETAAWVKEQNAVTFGYLEKIPYRDQIKERLKKMWNYEKYTLPIKKVIIPIFQKITDCRISM